MDPKNANIVLIAAQGNVHTHTEMRGIFRSTDGGKTWAAHRGAPGGDDYQNLWINPNDASNFIISNDGGSSITFDGGASFSSQYTMPTGQFYRINVDNQFPYRIYGGQQDNTSVSIASRELGSGGITPAAWTASAGGGATRAYFRTTR